MRIVSLIASATEIVSALGAESELVGRSHECDVPETVQALPAITKPRMDTGQSSRGIDTDVKALVRDGLSVYHIDDDVLQTLNPDVIVTQDQCEVCAASLDDVEAAVCDWVGRDVTIVSLHPDTLDDVLSDIKKVGAAIGREAKADALVGQLSDQLNGLQQAATAAASPPPTVFVLEWIDPPMGAGHWIPALVERAGADNVLTREGNPSPYVSWADIQEADPDFIIVAPCGFDVERTQREMVAIAPLNEWNGLRAVKDARVAIMDGNRYINRPSPSVVDSAFMINDIVHHGQPTRGPAAWRWLPA